MRRCETVHAYDWILERVRFGLVHSDGFLFCVGRRGKVEAMGSECIFAAQRVMEVSDLMLGGGDLRHTYSFHGFTVDVAEWPLRNSRSCTA